MGRSRMGWSMRAVIVAVALAGGAGAVRADRDVNSIDTARAFGWQGLTQFYSNGNGGFTVKNNAGNFTTATLTSAGDMTFAGTLASGAITSTGNVYAGASSQIGWTGRARITSAADSTITFAASGGFTLATLDSGGAFAPVSISASGDITSGAILSGKRATLATGTITTSQPIVSGTQTWNAGGVAFDADLIDVTNTASAATSTLIHRKVGGSTVFKVDKTANATLATAASQYCTLTLQGSDRGGTIAAAVNGLEITSSSGLYCQRLAIGSAWATNMDVVLTRAGSGILSQVNGANAQEFRVANTTNEHAGIQWFSGVAYFGSNVTSGGTQRAVVFGTAGAANASIRTNSTVRWDCDASNGHWLPAAPDVYDVGSTSQRIRDLSQARFHYLKETATTPTPVADTAIVYSKDSGGGKTQLMVMFPTGAAQQLSIEP